ncbi:MAG: hypothetical protein V2J07_11095 [Anaerolineae bacterium]|nr:hypothetical protein [Anaerolineae bacterium]
MKKKYSFLLLIAAMAAVLLFSSVEQVFATIVEPPHLGPAAGSWSWDDEEVSGTIVPQHQLIGAAEDDYAVLQSQGLHLDGPAQICHPYPGGQFGWNAEIRVMTLSGWQSVPTVNQWVPDEEGAYMTCAQVWHSGVYAVFGYWEKPEGWVEDPNFCAEVPDRFDVYVGPAATIPWSLWSPGDPDFGQRCVQPTDFVYIPGGLFWESPDGIMEIIWFLPNLGYYCGCENIYMDSSTIFD